MADTKRTDTRRVPSVEFRTTFGKLEEPVDVTVLGRVIGHWYPAGYPVAWGEPPSAPASRSAPVIPSGSLVVGTAETDRAQSGTPEEPDRAGPVPMEPLGQTSRSSGAGQPTGAGAGVLPRPDPPPGRVYIGEPPSLITVADPAFPLHQLIPPKPDGYVHDPHFNSKGSRPAPKVRK